MNDWNPGTPPHVAGLRIPKPNTSPEQCEDAYSFAPGIAAIADGAGQFFESRRWAKILANAFVAGPPWLGDPSAEDGFLGWVSNAAAEWGTSIPWESLDPIQNIKASEGSAATLTGVEYSASLDGTGGGSWRCLAVGDSCLFQISDNRLIDWLPVKRAADFSGTSLLLSTRRAENPDDLRRFVYEGEWHKGDELLLLTDAIAGWFLRQFEAGNTPWMTLAEHDKRSLPGFVTRLMTAGKMRIDDVTLVSVSFGAACPALSGLAPKVPSIGTGAEDWSKVPAPGRAIGRGTAPPPLRPTPPPIGVKPPPGSPPGGPGPGRRGPRPGGQPVPQPGGRPAAGSANPQATGPRPEGAPDTASVPPGAHRSPPSRRLRLVISAVALGCAALAAGYGVALLTHRQAPPPRPQPQVIPFLAAESEARELAVELVNFHGSDLSPYEDFLSAHMTSGAYQAMYNQLGFVKGTLGPLDSTGKLIAMTAPERSGSSVDFFAIVQQKLNATSRLAHKDIVKSYSRNIIIELVMTKSGSSWEAKAVTFLNATDSPLPPAAPPSKTVSNKSGKKQGTVHGQ